MQYEVLVTTEQRFYQTKDGCVWTPAALSAEFWQRYLVAFDYVRVLARVLEITGAPKEGWHRVDGESIGVYALPHYIGPLQYLQQRSRMLTILRQQIASASSMIVRAPSPIGNLASAVARHRQMPYFVEVVGDPYDVFAPGAVRHPLRPFLRWREPRRLRTLIRNAAGVSCVTEKVLQKRYPASEGAYTTHYSSIELAQEAYVVKPRSDDQFSSPRKRLISVGSLEQMYKAPDIVINAVANCVESGLDLELVWVGDGKHLEEMQALARNTTCPDRFCFKGNLPGAAAVRKEIDKADIFLLVSRTEGLPRAVIEAMARGVPCIGSNVGGIPELLPKDCLVPPDDAWALSEKIAECCSNPQVMAVMSDRCLKTSRKYRSEVLAKRRADYYTFIRKTAQRHSTSER